MYHQICKIKTVKHKRAEDFDNAVNRLLDDGWIIQEMFRVNQIDNSTIDSKLNEFFCALMVRYNDNSVSFKQ